MRIRCFLVAAIATAMAILAGGATLRIQGGEAKVSLAGEAQQRLREPHGELPSAPATVTLDWSGAVAILMDSGTSTDAKLLLQLSIGPSFRSGSKVVALFDRADGELSLASGGNAWQVTQFNFGVYLARATYDSQSGHLGLLLPVLMKPTNPATPGPIHGALILDCNLTGGSIHCSEVGFGLEPIVARSFPGEPGIADEVRKLLGAPRLSPSGGPGPNDKCCMGAWTCQCAGNYVCPPGGCSYVCQTCLPDPRCFECTAMGCVSGCYN